MHKIYKYSLIVLMLVISCRSNTIIPQKDMVLLLAKIQIIDASVARNEIRKTYFNNDTIDYYSKTIQSFGYTQAQFDSSLKYYAQNPKVLDKIYDKVIIELSKIETKIIADNKIVEDSIAKDTLRNLWDLKPSYEIPADSVQSTIDFKIPVKGPGIYTISADVCIYNDDESVDPSMLAYFYFNDKSKEGKRSVITLKYYQRLEESKNYSIQLELHNTLVTHLKGSLLNNRNTNNNFKKHASLSNIKVSYKQLLLKRPKPVKKEKRPAIKEL